MATIQLAITEEDRQRFAEQAQREGKTLDAWLISLARQHVVNLEPNPRKTSGRFETVEELMAFLRECSANSGLEREPDWEEHLKNIDESRRQGLPEV